MLNYVTELTTTYPTMTESEQSLLADTTKVQSTSSQPSAGQSLFSASTPLSQSPSQNVQVSETTTSGTTTTFLDITTTNQQMTATSQQTSMSDQTSELTTVAQSTVISSPSPDVHCCCRCCFPSTQMCKVCEGNSLTDASECANKEPKTVDRDTPKFEPPSALQGSKYPERLAYREEFVKLEQLTETLAALSETQKIDLGFMYSELIVDCLYNGSPCSVEKLVLMFASVHYC